MNRKDLNGIKIEQLLKANGLSDDDELTIENIRRAVTAAILENSETYKEETVDYTIGKMLNKF